MIDQLARSSAEGLRTSTRSDAGAGLADLHERQAQHRHHVGLAAATALVLALGIGWSAGWLSAHDGGDANQHPTRPVPSHRAVDHLCGAERVTCLGEGRYRFALDRPVTYAPPPGFGLDSGGGATAVMVESYRQVGDTAGITVLERVRAASPDGSGPAHGVADDPQAFVSWVASRPYLDASKVTQTTIDGRRAWRVQVVLSPGADAPNATCSLRFQCYALTYQRGAEPTGIWGKMAAEYTAFHLPGAGTTVVWSWIFTGNVDHLGGLDEAVHSLTWPAR